MNDYEFIVSFSQCYEFEVEAMSAEAAKQVAEQKLRAYFANQTALSTGSFLAMDLVVDIETCSLSIQNGRVLEDGQWRPIEESELQSRPSRLYYQLSWRFPFISKTKK